MKNTTRASLTNAVKAVVGILGFSLIVVGGGMERRALAADEKAASPDKPTVDLYGYIKLDASYDTAQSSPGDYYRIASPNANNLANSHQFNMTANQSRIGANVGGPDTLGAKLMGKVEFDFYNDNNYISSTASPSSAWDNKPIPQLRLAYASLKWEDEDFEIIAGQNWDVIAPLLTTTLNYYAGWNAGDLGYRRPQLRFTKGFKTGETSKVVGQFAFAKMVGSDSVQPTAANLNNGNDADFPMLQARVGAQGKFWTDSVASVGVYGHYGVEKYYLNAAQTDRDRVKSWSAGVDLTLPLTNMIAVSGEFTRGQDLRQFAGGIGNGAVLVGGRAHGVKTTDFWGQVTVKPTPSLAINGGGGQSKCDESDLVGTAATTAKRNSFAFVNTIYNLSKPVSVGLEVTQLSTDFMGAAGGRDTRFQTSLQYTF